MLFYGRDWSFIKIYLCINTMRGTYVSASGILVAQNPPSLRENKNIEILKQFVGSVVDPEIELE